MINEEEPSRLDDPLPRHPRYDMTRYRECKNGEILALQLMGNIDSLRFIWHPDYIEVLTHGHKLTISRGDIERLYRLFHGENSGKVQLNGYY